MLSQEAKITASNSAQDSGGKKDDSYFVAPPAVSLPKGGGAIKGTVRIW
jgi:hypothetical protein